MILIHLPIPNINLGCSEWWHGRTPARQGGWIDVPAEITMTATFKEIPNVLRRIAVSGGVIEEMLVHCIENAPPVMFGYVIIDREEHLSGYGWRIHMKALRMSYNGSTRPTKQRLCKCGRRIEYWHVNDLMNKVGISLDIVGQIWDNDLFKFLCCTCYKNQDPNDEHTGQYITILWNSEIPAGSAIRGARCPPE